MSTSQLNLRAGKNCLDELEWIREWTVGSAHLFGSDSALMDDVFLSSFLWSIPPHLPLKREEISALAICFVFKSRPLASFLLLVLFLHQASLLPGRMGSCALQVLTTAAPYPYKDEPAQTAPGQTNMQAAKPSSGSASFPHTSSHLCSPSSYQEPMGILMLSIRFL